MAERIELIEGDARETIPILSGPFDLLFVDAAKGQYREYIDLAEPLLTERAVLVIDNLLVGGEVALPERADRARSDESIDSARALNPQLLDSQRLAGIGAADRGRSRLRRAALAAFRSLRPQPGRP